jgi:hypothetical protein
VHRGLAPDDYPRPCHAWHAAHSAARPYAVAPRIGAQTEHAGAQGTAASIGAGSGLAWCDPVGAPVCAPVAPWSIGPPMSSAPVLAPRGAPVVVMPGLSAPYRRPCRAICRHRRRLVAPGLVVTGLVTGPRRPIRRASTTDLDLSIVADATSRLDSRKQPDTVLERQVYKTWNLV